MHARTRARFCTVFVALAAGLAVLTDPGSGPADAAPCSPTTGTSSCAVATQTTIAAGTLTVSASPNLYWNFVDNGYDQLESASATALTGCTTSSGASGTTCSGGTSPKLTVDDATGSNSGWSLSTYVTNSNLPSGAYLTFNGAGPAAPGNSVYSPNSTKPYAGGIPGTVCDYASSCTVANAASSCSHAPLGYTSCPNYGVNIVAGTSATSQVSMYSASAGSGSGAICFAVGFASGTGCVGTGSSAFYNLGLRGDTAAGSYTNAVVTLNINAGP